MKWFFKALRQYANFGGRARRKEFWMFVLFYQIFFILFLVIDITVYLIPENELWSGDSYRIFSITYLWAMLIPYWAVSIRRLHDTGRSGWYMLIALIPLIGGIWLLVLMMIDGKRDDNCYGSDPKIQMVDWNSDRSYSNAFIFASVAVLISNVVHLLNRLQCLSGISRFDDFLNILFSSTSMFTFNDYLRFLFPVALLLIGIFLRSGNKGRQVVAWCLLFYGFLILLMNCIPFIKFPGYIELLLSKTYAVSFIVSILIALGLLFVGIRLLLKKDPAVAAVLLIIGASLSIIVSLLNSVQSVHNFSVIVLFLGNINVIVYVVFLIFGCSLLRKSDDGVKQSTQQETVSVTHPKPELIIPQRQIKTQAMSKSVIAYQSYLGSGICDVCNRPLGSIKAYIVPNPVFYSSKAYRTYFKQVSPWMTDVDIERMKQQDHSPGSAVCENCIHMF